MNSATESKRTRIFVWAIWLLIVIVSLDIPGTAKDDFNSPSVAGVILHEEEEGERFSPGNPGIAGGNGPGGGIRLLDRPIGKPDKWHG